MKKIYNKLCAIAFALLGATSLSAQTDVTSTYLTNAGFDDESGWATSNVGVTSGGNMQDIPGWTKKAVGWSSGATFGYGGGGQVNGSSVPSTGPDGTATGGAFGFSGSWSADITYTQEVTLPAGVYTLTYKAYNAQTSTDGNNKIATNKIGFSSSSVTVYGTKTSFAASTWVEESFNFVLTSETTGNITVGATFPGASSSVTPRLVIDGVTLTHKSLSDVTESDPLDLTSMVSNTKSAWTGATETPNYDGITMVARYAGSDWTGDALSQTISGLPVGNYKLEAYCQAHSSWDTDAAEEGATGYTYLCANDYKLDVPIRNADEATTKELFTFDKISITDGTLTIKVVNEKLAANWISIYVKSLTYLGPDKTLYEQAFITKYATLKTLDQGAVPSDYATKIEKLINDYESSDATSMTLSELETANGSMDAILNEYDAIKTAYAPLSELITLCQSYSNNSIPKGDAKTTFDEAITTAQNVASTATTAALLTEEYNTLEAARQVYVVNAAPINDVTFDLTFKANNTVNGWTFNSAASTDRKITNYDGQDMVQCYASAFYTGDAMTQTLSGLHNGYYTVEAYCQAHSANWEGLSGVPTEGATDVTSLRANDIKIGVLFHDSKAASTKDLYTLENVEVKDGNLTIKVTNDQNGSKWILAHIKSVTFVKAFDVSGLQAQVTEDKAEAEAISGDMNADVKSQLNTAITNADATSDNPDALQTMIDDLGAAITAANASIADYTKLKKYIEMTEVFTDVTSYWNNYNDGVYTADNVEPTRQELNVVRFNAASAIYTNKVEVTGWTGDLANVMRSDQHWSGNTVSYYDANSWVANFVGLKHTLTTTITLPQGSYVLKAAGRSSSDATLRLNIKNGDTSIETVEYTGKDDLGYGIDTSGAANFSDEGTYANDGKGRGWEWEFAKFELNAETTVTLHVEVDYNNIQNLFGSFSDITLWMDDDTYLSVNGGAIDAPLAQAKALNTLPMGNSEMSALTSAIALGEAEITTADQLNEALAALETAIANANTWRTAYNEAKAPLITEMELFESDYNDNSVEWSNKCAKGQLCTTIWQAYITAIQEAAVAKDVVTDGYDFETHTTALKNARTAVDASIAVYANLKAEIGYANAYTLVVESNQTDYTAAINTAQAVWNGGTKEDTSAEILAMQNFKVLDYNYVMETYEGVATLNDWDGNWTNQLESQHYDGLGNTGDKYYDNNVNGDFANSQTFTLPAGTYVFSGIGRASSNGGATSYIKVDEKQVNFPQKGDTGYGINTSGVADFTNEATYANNDNGRGWEYRFIEFTLTEETEVTLSYGISCTGSWGSVFAPQLRAKKLTMTDKADIENETEEGYMVSYDREFAEGAWTTVMVPFDYTLPVGVVAEELNFIAFNGPDNNWISFKEVTELKANTPYILQNNSATTQLFADLGIKTIYSTTSINSVEAEGAVMKGTYKSISAAELVEQEGGDIIFINQNGEGKYIDDAQPADITFPAGRAYIVVDGSTFDIANNVAPRFTIFHGDDNINSIEETVAEEAQEEVIYDLAGRRIVKPTKAGIYIVNGKKMVIK